MWILVLGYLFIFFARVSDVTLSTMRILMLMRGKSINAAVIGFFEVIIYILALGQVIGSLNEPLRLIVYALGFATGNFVGSRVEERLAIGFATAQVISLENSDLMAEKMRDQGFGVTVLEGCGKQGTHQILHILLKRKDLPCFIGLARQIDKDAFVSVMDTRQIFGGYFSKIKAK
ncbi:MAG: DUF2179 domain-containing protein [Clostridiales bacterium]|jgi:uncharacterized protein YebE (UPF0316 family)|nr:DUF2179 domain-containing protein [Clostridiales bacterium]